MGIATTWRQRTNAECATLDISATKPQLLQSAALAIQVSLVIQLIKSSRILMKICELCTFVCSIKKKKKKKEKKKKNVCKTCI